MPLLHNIRNEQRRMKILHTYATVSTRYVFEDMDDPPHMYYIYLNGPTPHQAYGSASKTIYKMTKTTARRSRITATSERRWQKQISLIIFRRYRRLSLSAIEAEREQKMSLYRIPFSRARIWLRIWCRAYALMCQSHLCNILLRISRSSFLSFVSF